ncbi:Kinesin motor domain containing protein [Histomonas meleagridis]|uniref:Kinesin motor domain containing protein n=1 Tax=Histomonas meleagridis TaxID=135588 RepID=UPI0035596D4F|nr:Kinesin motor domain containing protein [Histomonas meleagridis]KAH0798463.1 Kinesin motor domain containing protein [Histomonas meleagridis]
MSSIKVAIRVKPSASHLKVWDINENENKISLANNGTIFQFNKVYVPSTTTEKIYSEMASDIVNGVMNGTNGTIFAYGSTGSGKTFTIMGDAQNPGIVPLAIDHIFNYIDDHPERSFIVNLSYFEIYNEKIKDLLKENSIADSRINYSKQVFKSSHSLIQAILMAESNRSTGSTLMNEHSSRSHAIVRLEVKSYNKKVGDGIELRSVLNLVDLAGSECQKNTNAEGDRQHEASMINKSLLALSKLIDALQNGKAIAVYRESKLTLYLRDSIGGNAQTTIICAISGENDQRSTSEYTLRFASKAMKIKNQPKVNEIKTEKAKIEELIRENNHLKEQLSQYESASMKSTRNTEIDFTYLSPKKQRSTNRKRSNSYSSGESSPIKIANSTSNEQISSQSSSDSEDTTLLLPKKILTRKTNPAKIFNSLSATPSPNNDIKEDEEISSEYEPILPKKKKTIPQINLPPIDQYYDQDDEEADRQAETLSRTIIENSIHSGFIDLPLKKKPNNKEIERLKKEIEELKLQNEKLIEEKEDLETQLESLDNDFTMEQTTLLDKIKILEKQNNFNGVSLTSNIDYKGKLLELEETIEKLTNENSEIKLKLLRREAEVKGALITQKFTKDKLAQKDSTIVQLGERITSQREQLGECQKELEEMKKRNEELTNKYCNLEQSYLSQEEIIIQQNEEKMLLQKTSKENHKNYCDVYTETDLKSTEIDGINDNLSILRKKLMKETEVSNQTNDFRKLQSSMIQRLKERQNIFTGKSSLIHQNTEGENVQKVFHVQQRGILCQSNLLKDTTNKILKIASSTKPKFSISKFDVYTTDPIDEENEVDKVNLGQLSWQPLYDIVLESSESQIIDIYNNYEEKEEETQTIDEIVDEDEYETEEEEEIDDENEVMEKSERNIENKNRNNMIEFLYVINFGLLFVLWIVQFGFSEKL